MDIKSYNDLQAPEYKKICNLLYHHICQNLVHASSKIRYSNPVWFLDWNPILGYSKQKSGVCLLFWSGESFDEVKLKPEGKFKAVQNIYIDVDEIDVDDIERWLAKSISIQLDYKNIIKRKGSLEKLT